MCEMPEPSSGSPAKSHSLLCLCLFFSKHIVMIDGLTLLICHLPFESPRQPLVRVQVYYRMNIVATFHELDENVNTLCKKMSQKWRSLRPVLSPLTSSLGREIPSVQDCSLQN